ncbi:MAG TPA: DMT family transporter, partial [Saliniramus sp.]|nr:DMT family transporter [Saliniramus sp.]
IVTPAQSAAFAPRRNILAVVAWMSGTLLSFSAVAVSVRELSGALSVFEILALRNMAGVVILVVLALARPSLRPGFVPHRMGLHFQRNFIHFLGQYAWALAVTLLPLATVFAIEFTTPAWVALFAALILREQLTRPRILAIVFGLIGILVILRPGSEALDPAALIVLFAAICFALVTIATKRLTGTESTFAILFWMNVMQLPMNYLGADPLFFLAIPDLPLLPLVGICVGGLSAHFCLTNAYRHGDAVVVVPLDFMRLPLIALVGFWLYAEPLDPFVFAGAIIILAGILQSLRAESLRTRMRVEK